MRFIPQYDRDVMNNLFAEGQEIKRYGFFSFDERDSLFSPEHPSSTEPGLQFAKHLVRAQAVLDTRSLLLDRTDEEFVTTYEIPHCLTPFFNSITRGQYVLELHKASQYREKAGFSLARRKPLNLQHVNQDTLHQALEGRNIGFLVDAYLGFADKASEIEREKLDPRSALVLAYPIESNC